MEINVRRIVLQLGESKNGDGRTLPIYGDMLEWLRMAKKTRDLKHPKCPFVFHRDGGPRRDDWGEGCVRAGVPGLLFHDLRRTAVRHMVRAVIPELIAMKISGHKTRSVFDRYNIVNDRDLTDAARKMDWHLTDLGILSDRSAKNEGEKRDDEKPSSLLQ